MKRIIIIIYFFNLLFLLKSQSINDTLNYGISDFPLHENQKSGIDSMGRRQGEWKNIVDDFLVFYKDSNFVINVEEHGYYVDNMKVGIWDIYSNDETLKKRSLIAQCVYSNDSLIFQINYRNNQISTIVQKEIIFRPNNLGYTGHVYIKNFIIFDNTGKIIYRESYAPDGIYEKFQY